MKDKKTILWLYKGSKKQLPFVGFIAVLRVIMTLFSVAFAMISKNIVDAAINKNKEEFFLRAAMLVLIILIQIVIKLFGNLLEEKIRLKLELSFKSKLYFNILRKDYSKITEYHSGDLLTRLTSDIAIISSGIISLVPSVCAMIFGIIAAFFALFTLDSFFAILFISGGALLLILISLFKGLLTELHKKVQESDSRLRAFFQESIMSVLMIKVFSAEKIMDKKAKERQDDYYRQSIKRRNITVVAFTGLSFVFSGASLFALIRCSYGILNGIITFGTLTAILQLVQQIQGPIAGLSTVMPSYFKILASGERVIEIEKIEDEYEDEKTLSLADYEDLESICFENITFSYGRENIFSETSVCIDKDDFAVISGISGIGKSTLLKLMLGVIYPESGSIYLKFKSGEKVKAGRHIRSLFSYVPQGNLLLSGTIKEAVSMICPDATDEQIKEAIKISCADEFIEKLPDGLETIIKEKGAGLSEGQVQRLAVARAVLSDAPIILLDEATSALDEATEVKLLENIKSLKNKTCILISHKNAAKKICNKEIVLEEKKIFINEI